MKYSKTVSDAEVLVLLIAVKYAVQILFVIPFDLQSVQVHSANCVKKI
jgi:hypothetical protein